MCPRQGHEVARDPAREPEAKVEVPPFAAAAAAIAANPLSAAAPPLLPVDAGAAE